MMLRVTTSIIDAIQHISTWVAVDDVYSCLMRTSFIYLKVLPKERQDSLVPPLILSLDAVIAEIAARRHPPVDLVAKDLDVLGDGEGVLELLDVLGRLVARRQHRHGDLQALGVGGVDHGRVRRRSDGEGVGVRLGREGDDLAAPAELCVLGDYCDGLRGVRVRTPRMPNLDSDEFLSLMAFT